MLLEARLGTRAFRRLMGGDRPTRGGAGNAPAESPQAVARHTRRRNGLQLHLPLAESQDQTNASSDDLGRERCPDGGPMVRIHLPPAASLLRTWVFGWSPHQCPSHFPAPATRHRKDHRGRGAGQYLRRGYRPLQRRTRLSRDLGAGRGSSSKFVRGNQQGHPRGAVGGSLGYSLRRQIDAFVWVAGNSVDGEVLGGMAEAGCSDTDWTRRYLQTRDRRRVNVEEKTNAQS